MKVLSRPFVSRDAGKVSVGPRSSTPTNHPHLPEAAMILVLSGSDRHSKTKKDGSNSKSLSAVGVTGR